MRKREKAAAIGGSSLLVVFAVLCLSVFALLSLSTVQADSRLGIAAAESVSDYYAADSEAEQILAQLRQGIVPDNVLADGNYYKYSCTISEVQRLDVEVQITGNS